RCSCSQSSVISPALTCRCTFSLSVYCRSPDRLFFFLMIRRPPSSTLFPYTTLFRSDRHVRLATEQELLRDFPDFELGALPPLGSLLGAPLYVDQEVLQHETVVFAAGSQTESVQIRTADLLQHEQVTALPLIKHADDNDKDWLR